MHSGTAEKNYFLRQKNRITGPFSLLKLTAMYRSGLLNCEDMVSADKSSWQYINVLFPDLGPGLPGILPEVRKENSNPAPVAVSTPGNRVQGLQASYRVSSPEKFSAPEAVETLPPFLELIADIGRTFALIWNFQEMLRNHIEKSSRFYAIAMVIHGVLSIVFVLLFGKYYSRSYHFFFAPLKGLCMTAALCAAAALVGLGAAKYCTPSGCKTPPSWKICAAGIFMNYGTLGCCTLALAHGIQLHVWVGLLLLFINSIMLCSSAMQMRDYLEQKHKNWKIPVICIVLLWNPVAAAFIYLFMNFI